MDNMLAATDEARLRLDLLGGFRASVAARPLDLTLLRAQGLLAYLALEGGSVRREAAQALLWDGDNTDPARLQARLKQVLHQLSRALAGRSWAGYHADRQVVRLDLSVMETDVQSIFEAIDAKGFDERLTAAPHVFDRLLEGLDSISEEFALWLSIRRRQLADLAVRRLEEKLAEQAGDPRAAIRIGQALMSLDATHELACRNLMAAYVATGEPVRALRVYDELWAVLDEQYDGVRPVDETQGLAARIKMGESLDDLLPARRAAPLALARPDSTPLAPAGERNAPQYAAGGLPGGTVPDAAVSGAGPARMTAPGSVAAPATLGTDKVRIFVAPARFSGESNGRAHLVRGFRELFVSSLVRFREWRVVDAPNPDRIQELAGGQQSYLLSIAGIELGDSVEIVLTFKDLPTDDLIWSEQFSADSSGWATLQKKVIHRMAMALNVHLSAERLAATYLLDDFALPVFDSWLRGQELVLNYRGRDWDRAVTLFRSVLERAPRFGRAYSSLSQLENGRHLYFPGVMRSKWRHQKAHEYAVEATRIDPIDNRAQLALGWSHAMMGRWDRSQVTLGHALELNQNDPWTIVSVALGWAFAGRLEEARRLADLALDVGIDPSPTHWGYQATLRFVCEDYRGCLEACGNADDGRAFLDLPAWKAAAHALLGEAEAAQAAMAEFLRLARENWALPDPPDDAEIGAWFLQCFPIRYPAAWRRLRDGVAGAGLPADLAPVEAS